MTDVVEKKVTDLNERLWEALTDNVDAEGQIDRDTSIPAMLATLTTGSTWTTEDGVEVMVVPVALPDTAWAAAERYLDSLGPSGSVHQGSVHQGSIWAAMLSAIRKE